MSDYVRHRFGWHRDPPDPRDYVPAHAKIKPLLQSLLRRTKLPTQVDLREYFPPVDDQRHFKACTAFACVGLLQYFERRATGRLIEPSKLFVYKVTRRLAGWKGDSGSQLRTTWKMIRQFGIPDERFWAYDPQQLDEEPDSFAYAAARSFRSIRYVRLDAFRKPGKKILTRAMAFLAAGLPFVLGFPVADTLTREAEIYAPTARDSILGGQSAIAVGYDTNRRIRSHKGAFLIRNSWGQEWGDAGYGWLPFVFVEERLATDLWTPLDRHWLTTGEFGLH